MGLVARATVVALALCACLALLATEAAPRPEATPKPLVMRSLSGKVVRMGSVRGEPLLGLRLRAFVCSRSNAEADRTVPVSVRIAHYVTRRRMTTGWGKPFRVLDHDLYWVVSLGEASGTCGYVAFEDFIPPDNYGGVESALGVLGYSSRFRCYGVALTVRAVLGSARARISQPIAATRRAIVECGRFRQTG